MIWSILMRARNEREKAGTSSKLWMRVPKKRKEKPAVHVRLQLVLRDDSEPNNEEKDYAEPWRP